MAYPSLPAHLIAKIRHYYHQENKGVRWIAERLNLSLNTVKKYRKVSSEIPPVEFDTPISPAFGSKSVQLPEPIERDVSPVTLSKPGWWWVVSDVHIPFHDRQSLEAGARKALYYGCAGIILNGDILDCMGLSSKFHKRPDDHKFRLERDYGRQFLGWLRGQFPKAQVIYKEGNHEERLVNFLATKASELFDIEELSIPHLLEFDQHKVQWVNDKRLLNLGKLCILHGHELPHGISAPVNPARGAFLRANHTVLIGHHHQTSVHHTKDIKDNPIVCWSTGCHCNLKPLYRPFNPWNHGGAFVDVGTDSSFTVLNYRIIDGEIR